MEYYIYLYIVVYLLLFLFISSVISQVYMCAIHANILSRETRMRGILEWITFARKEHRSFFPDIHLAVESWWPSSLFLEVTWRGIWIWSGIVVSVFFSCSEEAYEFNFCLFIYLYDFCLLISSTNLRVFDIELLYEMKWMFICKNKGCILLYIYCHAVHDSNNELQISFRSIFRIQHAWINFVLVLLRSLYVYAKI